MKTNQDWLHEHKLHDKPASRETGTILWFEGKTQVNKFPLTVPQQRKLREMCHEADKKERWYLIKQNVIVTKLGDKITIEIVSVEDEV